MSRITSFAIHGFLICFVVFASLFGTEAAAKPAVYGLTDKGVVREQNEDSMILLEDAGVFVVADGMGGHAAGEVASAMAVETMQNVTKLPVWGRFDAIWKNARTMMAFAGYEEANRQIMRASLSNASQRGMGTTMVSAVVYKDSVDVINLGDSRAYRIRNGAIEQISHDHSLVQELIDSGKLKTPEEIEAFPYKNIITQALGTQPKIRPDIFSNPIVPGDIYLLCSDGLFNELTDAEILKIIQDSGGNLQKATEILVQQANQHGGRDNITVVLILL